MGGAGRFGGAAGGAGGAGTGPDDVVDADYHRGGRPVQSNTH